MKEEGNENVTNCHSLKMTVADGKKRMTLLLNDRKAESGRVGNMLFLQNCKTPCHLPVIFMIYNEV